MNIKHILELIQASSSIDFSRPEPNSTMNAFIGKMKKEGLVEIGAGTMALVFHKPGTEDVVKVFRRDSCYVKFLTIISNSKNNIHFPKIIDYQMMKVPPYAGLNIVKMEKLVPVKSPDEVGVCRAASVYMNKPSDENKALLETTIHKFSSKNKAFIEAMDILVNAPTIGCHPDLHKDNIMRRKDGSLVIIDPYI